MTRLSPDQIEFGRADEADTVLLVFPDDADLFKPLLSGTLSIALAREIVAERRLESERANEIADDDYEHAAKDAQRIRDVAEGFDDE